MYLYPKLGTMAKILQSGSNMAVKIRENISSCRLRWNGLEGTVLVRNPWWNCFRRARELPS